MNGLTYIENLIENDEQLIELIESFLRSPFNSKKKLSQIFEELGLNDTVTLLDERSVYFIKTLDYFDSNITPSAKKLHKYPFWWELVEIYNRTKPRF